LKKFIFFLSLVTIFWGTTPKITLAQDIHFSQFYASPLSINPAETGFFNGNWRFTNNYRTQWSAIGIPYQTISGGLDKPFKVNQTSKFGMGAFFVNDNSGASNLNVNKIFVSCNYIFTVDNIHTFGIGVQAGYVLKSFSMTGLSLPSQFNTITGYFDPNLPNNTDSWDENINYTDINAGMNYSLSVNKSKTYFGAALFHINTPVESFLRQDQRLPMRIVFNGGVYFPLKNKLYLNPSFLTMYHKRASDWVFGALFHYVFTEPGVFDKIFAGAHARYSLNNIDAVIFTGGLSVYGFDIGVSYDVNISALQAATNNKGALEISLIYKNISKTLNTITLPCDRY